MSDWLDIQLGQVADIQAGPFGSMLHQRDYVAVGTPLITVKNLGNNRVTYNKIDHVSDSDAERLSKFVLKEGDIVFSRVGYVDRRAYITNREAGWLFSGSTLRIRVTDTTAIDPKFLSYYFGQKSVKETIKNLSVGATRPSLNTKLLEELDIFIPPFPNQCAIAGVLSSLDDKIDLLHRQNKTLEALAQTLFRQWFVEEPKDDWEEGFLRDLVDFKYGKGLKKSNRTGEGFPVVGSSGVVDYHSEYLVDGPGIITGRKGTLGKVIYLSENFFPIDTTFYITSKKVSPNLYFEYFLLKSIGFENMNTDSAVPGLNRNNALSIEVIVPTQDAITHFNDIVHPMFVKQYSNKNQIRTLEKLRDILLPKLMSGEVRVL